MVAIVEILGLLGLIVSSGVEETVVVEAALSYLVLALKLLDNKRAVETAQAEAAAEVLNSSWRPTSAEVHVGYRGESFR